MHPILIQFPNGFFIATYGLMVALGLVAGVALSSWRMKARGLAPELAYDVALVAVISGFLGARALFILTEWEQFLRTPLDLILSRNGFVFLGGLIGGAGGTLAYLRWRGLPVATVLDVLAPGMALGHALGRVGCHFAGCCYGGVCSVAGFGLRVAPQAQPDGNAFWNAYEDQLERGLIGAADVASLPVWPVQLMEAAALVVLAGGLLAWSRTARHAGSTLALYLAGYAMLRFGLEFLRGDEDRGVFFGGALSTSQIISLLIVPVAAGVWWWSRSQPLVGPGATVEAPSSAPADANDEAGRIRARAARRSHKS